MLTHHVVTLKAERKAESNAIMRSAAFPADYHPRSSTSVGMKISPNPSSLEDGAKSTIRRNGLSWTGLLAIAVNSWFAVSEG
jgi:hypothetical protein